jgi:hypothetical protein
VNPFTRFLLRRTADRELAELVAAWDVLERLVIRVYKAKTADAADAAEHQQVRSWMLAHYPRWQAALQPHWTGKRAGGEPVTEDPFAWLLHVETAAGFVDHWPALQMLPAAREALNELVLARRADHR